MSHSGMMDVVLAACALCSCVACYITKKSRFISKIFTSQTCTQPDPQEAVLGPYSLSNNFYLLIEILFI